jgi:CDP-diacylglycerol--glycerol-3-phosphate 3-phosphatidyltransferase
MLFGALAIYGHNTNSDTILLLALVALVGAYLVSYTRARSEGLGIPCRVGLFTRLERTLVMLGLLLTGFVLPGLWILAIGTQFTALQRMWYVRKVTQEADNTTSTIS